MDDVRVKINNWVIESETGKECSSWFTVPVSPEETKEKIQVLEKDFNSFYTPYDITDIELPENITVKELNTLINSTSSNVLEVEITNIHTGKKDWFNLPINYNNVQESLGMDLSCYKVTNAKAIIGCSIDELNQAFSKKRMVKVHRKKSNNTFIKGLYRRYNGDEYIHYITTENGKKVDCLTSGVKCWTDGKNSERIKALERVETINIERMEKRIGRNRPGHNAKQALETVKSMQKSVQPQAVPRKK